MGKKKNLSAAELGRKGGMATGRKGLAAMSPEQRAEIQAKGVKAAAAKKKAARKGKKK